VPNRQQARATPAELERPLPLMAAMVDCGVGCYWLEPGGMLNLDAAILAIWGVSLEELALPYRSALLSFVHADDVPIARTLRAFQAAPSKTSVPVATFRVVRPDGDLRWVQVREHASEAVAGASSGVYGVAIDLTTVKRDEQALVRQQTHDAVGTLSAGLAHDFNNLLFAILGNATLALGMVQVPEQHPLRESLREIERASARASELVQRLSLFSRPPQPKRRWIELTEVIDEALRGLRRSTLPARVQVRVQSGSASYAILADAKLAEQVVSNLIANAAQAIEGQDRAIDLELSHVTLADQPWLRALELAPGVYVSLAVRDYGNGMDQATLDRAFEPFFSTRPKGKGLGLGLCIAQAVMRSHGGDVRVESELGHGTCAHVYWPSVATNF
jgi:PAS domain S-box-containing protein